MLPAWTSWGYPSSTSCARHVAATWPPATRMARAMTALISNLLIVSGAYREIIALNEEILQLGDAVEPRLFVAQAKRMVGEHASARATYEDVLKAPDLPSSTRAVTLHELADIDAAQGDYAAARAKYEEALRARRELGDRRGAAATLHQLAVIDANQGDYAAARAKYEEALRIAREVGDRAGAAATFAQLGWLALQWRKREAAAFRLYLVAWFLLKPLGHVDAQTVEGNLIQMAANLGYDEVEIARIVQETAEVFARDQESQMIDEALGEEP
jgi:tetratricopeptide (TPR) repeat protein